MADMASTVLILRVVRRENEWGARIPLKLRKPSDICNI